MSAIFSRTFRSLEADRARPRGVEWLLALLFAAWGAWFVLGRITVYEVTPTARLEVTRAAHLVAAPVAGRVLQTNLAIGLRVDAGDVLVVLDSEPERRALAEKRTRCEALAARGQGLRSEIEAERKALAVQRKARGAALEESRDLLAAAENQATLLERVASRAEDLYARRAGALAEAQKARSEAEAARATARASARAVARLEQDRLAQEGDRLTRVAKLEREAVELAGEAAVEEAAIRRLEYDVELCSIRSPVSGVVGEVAEFRVGSVVRAADRLGSVVPPGEPRAVAWFPAAIVGRIQPGQAARLRLDGFPWTQYGTLKAVVAAVGNEVSSGQIRVEFTLADEVSQIPVNHGMPGSAEVAVEQVSPAVLVLRAAGQFLGVNRPKA
jgi:membrane fusion protein (multidrug efflux system)